MGPAELLFFLITYVVVFGGLTAWLATTKHRDGCMWFVLGALIGPLALIAVGLAPAGQSAPETPRTPATPVYSSPSQSLPAGVEPAGGLTKRCPDCAETVQADARICRFCRYTFVAAQLEPEPQVQTTGPAGLAVPAPPRQLGTWMLDTQVPGFVPRARVALAVEGTSLRLESASYMLMMTFAKVTAREQSGSLEIRDDLKTILLQPTEGQDPATIARSLTPPP